MKLHHRTDAFTSSNVIFVCCSSYLLPDKNRNSKQKTSVAKRTVNPVWNYTFAYDDVSLNELSERALELTIWDHDRLASNEFLGGVRFSLGTGEFAGSKYDRKNRFKPHYFSPPICRQALQQKCRLDGFNGQRAVIVAEYD